MAEYTVKAPDGKTITLQGPDGASEADIIAQAQALYTPKAAAPAARPARPAAKPAPRRQAAPNQFLEKYNAIRGGLISQVKDPALQKRALARFDSDPRVQRLRKLAGLAPLSTRQGEVRATAKKAVSDPSRSNPLRLTLDAMFPGAGTLLKSFAPNAMEAAQAGIEQSLFDLPTRLRGLVGKGFKEEQAENRRLQAQNRPAAIAGQLAGSFGTGGGIGAGVRLGAARLAPYAPKVANVLQNLVTLEKGKKLANATKIVGTGAAAGGAQAAGEGNDILEGAGYGAGGAATLVGGAKGLGWLGGKAKDLFRVSGADALLRRYTSITADELARRLDAFRKTGKGEPTIYELLDQPDREALRGVSKRMPGGARERQSELARERVAAIPGEIASATAAATAPAQRAARNQIAKDLASSRGAEQPELEEARLAIKAVRDPTEMDTVRSQEAKNVMRPHDDRRAFNSVNDLFPETIQLDESGAPHVVNADPEASAVIRSAAGRLMMRDPEQGISVRDVTNLISRLGRMTTSSNAIEANNAHNAVEHVMDALERELPDILPEIQRMRSAWRSRSTMIEGMLEGTKGRTRTGAGFAGGDAKDVRNLYNTPEGTTGRGAGQVHQLTENLGAGTTSSLGTVRDIAESAATQRALAGNLGKQAAGEITQAARTQSGSARKLASLIPEQPGNVEEVGAGDLVALAAGLNPASMLYTKAQMLNRLMRLTDSIPEGRARVIVDMLLSRDPAMTQRAINALRNERNTGPIFQYLSFLTGQASGSAASNGNDLPTPEVGSSVPSVEDDLNSLQGDESEIAPPDVGDSPYAETLQNLYATENPDLLELVQRVKGQESGGQQFDADGNPLESSAGAIGVMQVMPDTAPEAARLAGLPWDENAYYNDPAYNELLGIAYLSEQLRKYDGDVERALAAYNAGPGAVDDALSMHDANWLENLPAETQDYVARVA